MRLVVVYVVLSVVYLVVRSLDLPVAVSLATKPLPFVLLLVSMARAMPVAGRRWAIVAALCFSIGGDEFLALKGVPWGFQAGLGSFLVGHLFFIAAFVARPSVVPWRAALSVLAIPYGVALNLVLQPNVGPNGPAVVAYSVVLLGMFVTTLLSTGVPSRVVFGAGLFVLSDSLLALQLFGFAFPGGSVVSMSLYDAAQWFLVTTPEADRRAM